VVSALLSVITGYLIVHIFLHEDNLIPVKYFEKRYSVTFERTIVYYELFLLFITILGIYLYLHAIAGNIGGLQNYVLRPIYVRVKLIELRAQAFTGWNLSLSLSSYLISFIYAANLFGGVVYTFQTKSRYIGLIPLPINLIYSIAMVGRYALVNTTAIWFFAFWFTIYFYDSKRYEKLTLRLRKLIVFLSLFVIAFIVWLLIIRSVIEGSATDYVVKYIYAYLSGPLAAFHKFTQSNFSFSYGVETFHSIFKWLAKFGIIDKYYVGGPNLEWTMVGGIALNTYTFVYSFYKDFGIFGLTIVAALWGGLSRMALHWLEQSYSFTRLFIVSIFTFSLFMSFYAFYLKIFTTLVFYLIITLIADLIMRRKRLYYIN